MRSMISSRLISWNLPDLKTIDRILTTEIQKIPIVFGTDHNFIVPTGIAMLSLVKKADSPYDIFVIISDDVTEEDRKKLDSAINSGEAHASSVTFIKIGPTFRNGFETRGVSNACYYRLLIPWLIPQYDKVIYSDSDVIFKGSLRDFYNFDLQDNYVGGVGGKIWSKSLLKRYLNRKGLDEKDYINSGVLLINSSLLRKNDLKDSFINLASKNFVYQDQDIINIVCKGKIMHLPEEYNVKPKNVDRVGDQNVKVLHFIGAKPWDTDLNHGEEWWKLYKDSVFFDKDQSSFQRWNSLRIMSLMKKKMEKLKLVIRLLLS